MDTLFFLFFSFRFCFLRKRLPGLRKLFSLPDESSPLMNILLIFPYLCYLLHICIQYKAETACYQPQEERNIRLLEILVLIYCPIEGTLWCI